jgi:site-specific DNA-methyltransferase (adenine-specific)
MTTFARIEQGDSSKMTEILADISGKVSLIVTSPPYFNAISYEAHASHSSQNYRDRYVENYDLEYLPFLDSVWEQCLVMLKPGGYLCINVGSVLENGNHLPLPNDLASRLLSELTGFSHFNTILWHKVTAGVKRAGGVISRPYPGYWYPNIMTEHILVFQKRGGQASSTSKRVPEDWFNPIWDIAPVPSRSANHPAPFPEEIPHRLVSLFTEPGDIVLDPFNGSGTSTKAAFDLGRSAVGVELQNSYVKLARKRLDEESSLRSIQLQLGLTPREKFIPGASQGKTRHGSGIAANRNSSNS